LISRAETKEIVAFTSTHVLTEAAHHLMTLEAAALYGWKSKIVEHLRKQPTAIQSLTNFRQAIEKIAQLNIQVLTVPSGLIATAAAVSQQHGLLSNDALIIALMHANGLSHLASHDADFDRVPGISRYSPA
jgi:predicted nucleic acid-binding protein